MGISVLILTLDRSCMYFYIHGVKIITTAQAMVLIEKRTYSSCFYCNLFAMTLFCAYKTCALYQLLVLFIAHFVQIIIISLFSKKRGVLICSCWSAGVTKYFEPG
jgi:hypothetical protein